MDQTRRHRIRIISNYELSESDTSFGIKVHQVKRKHFLEPWHQNLGLYDNHAHRNQTSYSKKHAVYKH